MLYQYINQAKAQPHEVKVILPKAREMYAKLMAERNAETAQKIIDTSEKLDPPPVKKKPAPQFTKNGKLIYDSLTAKNWKMADRGYNLVSKNKGALSIDLTNSDKGAVILNDMRLELNQEESGLIVTKAQVLKAEIIQANVEQSVRADTVVDTTASITAELAGTIPPPMPPAK